jgi:hypothetical protein
MSRPPVRGCSSAPVPAASALPGSNARRAARSASVAAGSRRCVSCAHCSPLSRIRPVCSPTGAARSNACSCCRGLAGKPTKAGRHRATHDRRARPAQAHRTGHHDSRTLAGGERRRSWPKPVTPPDSPPLGPWSNTPGWRHGRTPPASHRPHQAHRARPTRAAAGRLAHRVGSAEGQSRLLQPLPTPHYPGAQQAHPDAGADRDRRGHPAAATRGHHHRPGMGFHRGHPRHPTPTGTSGRWLTSAASSSGRSGRALRGIETHMISTLIMGSPARRLHNPITRCWALPHHRYAGTDDGRGTDQTLDTNRLTLMSECVWHVVPTNPRL